MTDAGEVLHIVAGSSHRRSVAEGLRDGGPSTPSTLAERLDGGMDVTHVSRALGDLRDVGAVELLVPDEKRKGRVYAVTDAGRRALDRLNGVDGDDTTHLRLGADVACWGTHDGVMFKCPDCDREHFLALVATADADDPRECKCGTVFPAAHLEVRGGADD